MAARIRTVLLVAGAGGILCTGAALAQSAPPRSVYLPQLEVVGNDLRESATSHVDGFVARRSATATKTDAPVAATPRAISVVTSDEIEARAEQSVTEALQYTAGVSNSFQERSTFGRQYPYIRGFLTYQFLDGLKLHDSNWPVEPYGLERIEVLKGPASILYGQASPGGLIGLVSKRPTLVPYREVLLQTGSYGRLQGGVDLSGPVEGSPGLFYRMTGLGRIANGEVDFTAEDRAYIAPALTWKPDGATTFTILAAYQYDPRLSLAQTLPAAGTLFPTARGFIARDTFLGDPNYRNTSRTSSRIGYEFEHAFDEVWSFRQNARYTRYDIHAEEIQSLGRIVGLSALQRQAFLAHYTIELFQIDSRLRARFATGPIEHTLLLGVDYASIPNYQGLGTLAAPALDPYNPTYGITLSRMPVLQQKRDLDQSQLGLYAQDQMRIGNLSIVAGLRQDWLRLTSETERLNAATGRYVASPKTRQDDAALTPSVAAIYSFDTGLAPYISYARSFFPVPGTDFAGNMFKPNTGESLEGGIKYQPPGTDILLTGAVFEIRQQNVLTTDPVNPGFAVQTGEVRSRGFEIEAKASLGRGTDLTVAYTNLDLRTTRSTTANLGKVPVGVPQEQVSAWANHRVLTGPLAGLSLGAGIRFVGATFGDQANTFRVPGYALYDAALRYDLGALDPTLAGWDFALNGRNLTDKRYVSNCDALTSCYYGVGRSVLATLRVCW